MLPDCITMSSGFGLLLIETPLAVQMVKPTVPKLASNTSLMANYFEIPPDELEAKAIADPRAAVASDIATLRAIPAVPSTMLVSGLVYDTDAGLIEIVVPLAPIRPEQHE